MCWKTNAIDIDIDKYALHLQKLCYQYFKQNEIKIGQI